MAGRGRPIEKSPSSVLVAPTSPASSMRAIVVRDPLDIHSFLRHSRGHGVTKPNKLPLTDQVVVFTGKLSSIGRKEAHALVIRLGGSAGDEVTAKTTMVIVGAEGFPSGEKSQKLRKAEELNIRVLSESDFCRMAGLQPPEDLKQQYYAQRDVLGMYAGLREDHLRYMQKWGLIRPVL